LKDGCYVVDKSKRLKKKLEELGCISIRWNWLKKYGIGRRLGLFFK
jgi:hypothetical protein